MAFSVTMPALGESVSEGTVTRWLKQEGDQVAVDEPLLEVSTDKVDTEIPSPAAGVLQRIVVPEDETVAVGAELAVIGDGSAEGSGDQQPQEQSGEQEAPPAAPEQQAQQAQQSEQSTMEAQPQVEQQLQAQGDQPEQRQSQPEPLEQGQQDGGPEQGGGDQQSGGQQ